MAQTEGAALLAQALRSRGHTQADAWRELKIDSGHMSKLLSGDRRPSMPLSARIEELYGVPMSSWMRLIASTGGEAA